MSAPANRHLKSLERLWEERRAGRPLPSRADLDVSVLRPWLGSLAIFEFQKERGAIFRLCGTSLHKRFGGELTGHPVSALKLDMAGYLERYFTATLTTQKPQWATHIAEKDGSIITFEEIFLPLAGSDVGAALILFASYPQGHSS